MKLYLIPLLLLLLSIHSCKKGCTDPFAKNYNAKKTKDNGKCKTYKQVSLKSVRIKKIPEYNSTNSPWDNGTGNDKDNDNSYPDLYLSYKAENGYVFEPNNYLPTVNPSNVNWLQILDVPLKQDKWKENKGFYVFLYEVDIDSAYYELIDSVWFYPFKHGVKYNTFEDTMTVKQNNIEFEAHLKWE